MNGEITDEIKSRMISKAKSIHGEIYPCISHKDFGTCFTVQMGTILFWFNDNTHNTKVIQEVINEETED